jgi:hypothetical protein
VQWTLSSSDAVRAIISQQYKSRHDDDLNIPLSVQPWGSDGDKRRYYLMQGNDDTSFRVYRESNPAGLQRTWWSVAGSIDELKALADKLENKDGGPKAKAFAKKIMNSIPLFEATEEKRRRREYRQMRKEQFRRPEPGFSLYEGRTRGKRMKYTYSDDEGDFLSDSTTRRSTRNTRQHTPAEPRGPVTTASGRQIRAPNRLNAENASDGAPSANNSVQGDGSQPDMKTTTRSGRPQRSAAANHGMNGWTGTGRKRKSDEYEYDESEEEGSEPDYGDDEEDEHVPDEEEEDEEEFEEEDLMDEEGLDNDPHKSSFVFKFPIRVAFDDNNTVRQIPGPPVVTEKHKHPRAAHRNVVVSDDSEGSDGGAGSPEEPADTEPEPPAAEVIAVAIKPITLVGPADKAARTDVVQAVEPAEKSGNDADEPMTDAGVVTKSPPTPSSQQATSIAFRGSPEVARSASLFANIDPTK